MINHTPSKDRLFRNLSPAYTIIRYLFYRRPFFPFAIGKFFATQNKLRLIRQPPN